MANDSEQQFHEKEKTELKTGQFASSEDRASESEDAPSPFARPVKDSPFARPLENSKESHAPKPPSPDSHNEYATFGRPSDSAKPSDNWTAGWPIKSKAPFKSEEDSPYSKVYEGTPYAKFISHVTGETPKPLSSDKLAAAPLNNEPPDLATDQYKLLDLIGQGGMGSVYRAQDLRLQKEVAIKLIRPELATDQTALKRFYQECTALSQLNHPNIVAVYAIHATATGAPYLVMANIRGESLGSAIKKLGKMDAARALSIFSDIGEALQYAHGRGVIHRDLKPNNILLDSAGSAKVVDFGIAKVAGKGTGETVTGLTQMGDMFGTPAYMSPEQCEGEPLDARSDIYSFGCVMYETLNGSPPFSESNPFKLMTKHVNEKAPSLEAVGISRPLAKIVAKCLEKKPENRYQSVDELMQDITLVRSSKEPLNVHKKASPIPKVKFTPTGILKTIAAVLALVIVSYSTYMLTRPVVEYGGALAGVVVAPSSVEIISMHSKPKIEKPVLKKPPSVTAKPYVPITAPPLTEEQKNAYRKLLYDVTPTQQDSLEPFLEDDKALAPFLLDEIKSPDNTIARASSVILTEMGPQVLPGLIEALKADSNRWIKDAIESMGDTGVAALEPLLTDNDPQIRTRAVATMHGAINDTIMPGKLSNMLMWLALNDPEATVREKASAALAMSPQNEIVNNILSYNALNDPSVSVRTASILALASVAGREGDTSKTTLEVFGWVMQKETSDPIKQAVFQTSYVRDYGAALAPYLRGAYYTGSHAVQSSLFNLCYNTTIGEAMIPELLDNITKDEYGGISAISALKSLKARAKPSLPVLNATLTKFRIERPSDKWRQDQLSKAIDEISKY